LAGIEVDPSDYLGLAIPSQLSSALEIDAEILGYEKQYNSASLGTNTVPSRLFSCLGISFPVFAVNPIFPSGADALNPIGSDPFGR
jgi:hypothetical protein